MASTAILHEKPRKSGKASFSHLTDEKNEVSESSGTMKHNRQGPNYHLNLDLSLNILPQWCDFYFLIRWIYELK